MTRKDKGWKGKASQGKEIHGKARQHMIKHGKERQGMAWHDKERQGMKRHEKDISLEFEALLIDKPTKLYFKQFFA
jgi:hypothetical protein